MVEHRGPSEREPCVPEQHARSPGNGCFAWPFRLIDATCIMERFSKGRALVLLARSLPMLSDAGRAARINDQHSRGNELPLRILSRASLMVQENVVA